MQVTETINDGLKRELTITVPASELEAQVSSRLEELKTQVKIDGFRPGKVPAAHLRKVYGRQVMAEIVQKIVTEDSQKAIEGKGLRPALQPEIGFSEDEGDVEKVMAGEGDLVFTVEFEIIPEFEVIDFKKLKLEKPVAEVSDEEVNEAVEQIAAEQRDFVPREGKDAKAEKGDRVIIDFEGSIDGELFEGGTAQDAPLELGSNSFIPGFEDQLAGAKEGDDTEVKVAFPADYGVEKLAGKDAVFKVKVKAVEEPINVAIDDTLAVRVGLDTLDALRDAIKEQISGHFEEASKAKLKRALLDALDEAHEFELPGKLLEQEFEQIWQQVLEDMKKEGKSFDDGGADEEETRAEFRKISERRVRLGLLMGDLGDKNKILVTDDEVNSALMEQARQYQGQEKQVIEYYQKNPEALASLRAPIFEQKVVEFIIEQADVTEKEVSREELFQDPDQEAAEAKSEKKAKPKKAAAKKPAAKKPAAKKKAPAKKKPAAKKD